MDTIDGNIARVVVGSEVMMVPVLMFVTVSVTSVTVVVMSVMVTIFVGVPIGMSAMSVAIRKGVMVAMMPMSVMSRISVMQMAIRWCEVGLGDGLALSLRQRRTVGSCQQDGGANY